MEIIKSNIIEGVSYKNIMVFKGMIIHYYNFIVLID